MKSSVAKDPTGTDVSSSRIGTGAFEPSDRPDEDMKVSMEDAPSDEVSQMFFDAQSSFDDVAARSNGASSPFTSKLSTSSRRPSDVGSIPLNPLSLQIVNGGGHGEVEDEFETIPARSGQSQAQSYSKASVEDPDSQQQPAIDFLKDDPSEMTNGRRIALWMMKRFAWYNPQLKSEVNRSGVDQILDAGKYRTQDGYPVKYTKEETPSLEKAWAYFEHVAMPRFLLEEKADTTKKGLLTRIVHKFSKANKQLQRAEPGEAEKPTRLYSPIFTPHKQLGDFGLGIGLYFSTIRAMSLLVIAAGLIHIPNLLYFASQEYSNGQAEVNDALKGSAVCTKTKWVPCPTCNEEQFSTNAFLVDITNANATYAKKNLCEGATIETGSINYACLLFIVAATMVFSRYMQRVEVQFDEDEQTAQDYSVVIVNPPGDATDPEEWAAYFSRAFDAHVTGCTVAVDNDILVHTLVERREKMRMLELMVEPGTSLDIVTLAGIAASIERSRTLFQSILALVVPGIPEIFSRMAVLTAKVQGLAQQDYPVTNVFVTFETEASQRLVLEKLTVGQAAIDRNRESSVGDAKYLFRGVHLLSLHEPEEPDSIRWADLNVTFLERLKQQFFTALATVVAVIVVAVVVNIVDDTQDAWTAITISIANALFPMFAKALTYNEAHPSHGSLQTSLYYKIAIFRWVTTAMIITLVTPFEETLMFGNSQGLIQQVYTQFIAEITTTSALQLADPFGHIQRHVLAPRATTQDAMNLNMQGSKFELAERYTAVAKLLFLTFWYCSIFPMAFFWCALALQILYYLDKLSLTRTWKRVPKLGATISQFNRTYFLPVSVIAMAVMSSYYWAGFPFDNLCENQGEQVPANYVGNQSVPVFEDEDLASIIASWSGRPEDPSIRIHEIIKTFTIAPNSSTYVYCNQNYFASGRFTFPFIPYWQLEGEEWMTEEQEQVTTIYGWTAAAFIVAMIIIFIYQVAAWFCSYFYGSYKPTGDDQGENFSELESASIYIPQVESPLFSYPLLACCVDDIDADMLEWTDPDHPHAFYDLTKDAQALIRGIDISHKVVFSQVAHWPPTEK